jgi:hypothetical protein
VRISKYDDEPIQKQDHSKDIRRVTFPDSNVWGLEDGKIAKRPIWTHRVRIGTLETLGTLQLYFYMYVIARLSALPGLAFFSKNPRGPHVVTEV